MRKAVFTSSNAIRALAALPRPPLLRGSTSSTGASLKRRVMISRSILSREWRARSSRSACRLAFMSMSLVCDLDGTLYDERLYVESGLRAVADFGEQQCGWDADASFRFMVEVLDTQGRGAIFDHWLASHGRISRTLVQECVKRYRHHTPDLKLDPAAKKLLAALADHPLYLVTDGHKIAQVRKVEALG